MNTNLILVTLLQRNFSLNQLDIKYNTLIEWFLTYLILLYILINEIKSYNTEYIQAIGSINTLVFLNNSDIP